MKNDLVILDDSMLIGKGRDRACYIHPYDKKLCIKVAIKAEKQSKREQRYLNYLKRKGKDISLISDFKGTIYTNLGKGYIFELARDANNNIAQNITNSIKLNLISEEETKQIIKLIEQYLTEQKICAYDLSPNNVVITKDKTGNLSCKIIDGIGEAKPNPFLTRIPSLILKSQKRSLARFKRKVNTMLNESSNQ